MCYNCLLLYYVSVSFCHWTLIESQRKTVVSVTGAAAPRQDITGIYDVLNVSFVPPCGSSLWQLGKAAACNELIIPPPPPSLCVFIRDCCAELFRQICVSCGKSYDTRRDQHHFSVFMNSFWFMDLCLAYGNTKRHAFHSCATVFKTRDWFNITFVFLSILW